MRNPPWSKDELILALDLYFSLGRDGYHINTNNVQNLSKLLKKMGNSNKIQADNYRTPASVVMKLMNFKSIDPSYPGTGLSATANGDKIVWQEFASNLVRLQETAQAIRNAFNSGIFYKQEETLYISEAPEGNILTRLHVTKERNGKLVESRKKRALKEQGKLTCEVCSFNFEEVYGERGIGFIECHHVKPLHTLEPGSKTRLEDLVLVCANCHRMIHAQQPWLSVAELREILQT